MTVTEQQLVALAEGNGIGIQCIDTGEYRVTATKVVDEMGFTEVFEYAVETMGGLEHLLLRLVWEVNGGTGSWSGQHFTWDQ